MAALRRELRTTKRTAIARRRHFTPFKTPTRPPSGTYDPVLDQQLGAARRGLQDLTQDTELSNTRSSDDWTIRRNDIQRNLGNSLSDLIRGYTNLGSAQTQQANAAGVLGGGWAAQAQAKRAANQAREQGRIETAGNRDLASTDLAFQRGNEDRNTNLTRAKREFGQYGLDIGQSRLYQAKTTGWVPPSRPKSEHSKGGLTYRDIGKGRHVLPSGQVVTGPQLAALIRQAGLRRKYLKKPDLRASKL